MKNRCKSGEYGLRLLKLLAVGAISWVMLVWMGDYYLMLSEPKSMAKNVIIYGLQIYYPVLFLIFVSVSVAALRYRRR